MCVRGSICPAASSNSGSGGIPRPVRTGRGGIVRHGQQPVHVGLHHHDTSGSEGDRQGDVLHDVPERDEPGVGDCHYNRRTGPRTRDDQLNDHHGHAGHRAAGWQRRIGGFLGGRGGPFPAGCTGHVKNGRSDPGRLHRTSRSSAPTTRRIPPVPGRRAPAAERARRPGLGCAASSTWLALFMFDPPIAPSQSIAQSIAARLNLRPTCRSLRRPHREIGRPWPGLSGVRA